MPDPVSATSPGVPPAVICECCEQPLPPGTRARIDRESGVIICVECYEALSNA